MLGSVLMFVYVADCGTLSDEDVWARESFASNKIIYSRRDLKDVSPEKGK